MANERKDQSSYVHNDKQYTAERHGTKECNVKNELYIVQDEERETYRLFSIFASNDRIFFYLTI